MIRRADTQDFDPVRWWNEHYDQAASIVVDFLESDGIALEGKLVADVGCGDGIIDLGVLKKGRPAKLVGYDLRPVDVDGLLRAGQAAEVLEELPPDDVLSFAVSEQTLIPAPPDTFDIVYSWSAFEHVARPVQVLEEIARILKPGGAFFLQLWPFFDSCTRGAPVAALRRPVPAPAARRRGHPRGRRRSSRNRPVTAGRRRVPQPQPHHAGGAAPGAVAHGFPRAQAAPADAHGARARRGQPPLAGRRGGRRHRAPGHDRARAGICRR